VMLLLWLAAGVAYYQVLRFAHRFVAAVLWLRDPQAGELADELIGD